MFQYKSEKLAYVCIQFKRCIIINNIVNLQEQFFPCRTLSYRLTHSVWGQEEAGDERIVSSDFSFSSRSSISS